MTPEDQKARDEFEAWERQRGGNLKRHQGGLYANSAVQGHWKAWQESRRTYRATVLEEAALACEKVGDDYGQSEGGRWPELKSDAQTGARDCESAIRALIAKEG